MLSVPQSANLNTEMQMPHSTMGCEARIPVQAAGLIVVITVVVVGVDKINPRHHCPEFFGRFKDRDRTR